MVFYGFFGALQIFKHVVGSLHISYTKYAKLFFKVFDQGNICHYLPGGTGGRGILKRVTNGDIGGRFKIWHFRGDVIFEWPHTLTANYYVSTENKLLNKINT